MYNRIVVPLDGSILGEVVLPHATKLAVYTGAELLLIRVIVVPVYAYCDDSALFNLPILACGEAVAREYLEQVALALTKTVGKVTTHVDRGDVANTIVRCAIRARADLIAMERVMLAPDRPGSRAV